MKTLAALLILLSTVSVQAGSSDGGYGKPGGVSYTPGTPPSKGGSRAIQLNLSSSTLDAFLKVSPLSKLVSTSDGGYGKGTKVSLTALEGAKSVRVLGDLSSGEIAFIIVDKNQNEDAFVIAPDAISLIEKSVAEALRQSIQSQGQVVVIAGIAI